MHRWPWTRDVTAAHANRGEPLIRRADIVTSGIASIEGEAAGLSGLQTQNEFM
jgi:hypothetical protein